VEAPDELGVDQADVERYEALRAEALAGEPGWRHGLAVFQGRGMVAWLRAARNLPAMAARPLERTDTDDQLGGELVGVLASMALAVVR
jgi:hypothetical protein